jgi:hypothetical protein
LVAGNSATHATPHEASSNHPEKTRLIEFGRYAAQNRKRRGLGKPETFNFVWNAV